MQNPPYCPWHTRDWIADTSDLNDHEYAAYHKLLMHYWMNGPLPADESRLARIANQSKKVFLKGWPRLRKYFSQKDDHLYQKRMEKEVRKVAQWVEQKSLAGKRSAKGRQRSLDGRWIGPSNGGSNGHPTPYSLGEGRGVASEKEISSSTPDTSYKAENGGGETGGLPRSDPDAFRQRDYMVEVLEKCGGTGLRNGMLGTLFLLGRHAPTRVITEALGSLQDRRLRGLDPDGSGPLSNPTSYFLGTIRRLLEEIGVDAHIHWATERAKEDP